MNRAAIFLTVLLCGCGHTVKQPVTRLPRAASVREAISMRASVAMPEPPAVRVSITNCTNVLTITGMAVTWNIQSNCYFHGFPTFNMNSLNGECLVLEWNVSPLDPWWKVQRSTNLMVGWHDAGLIVTGIGEARTVWPMEEQACYYRITQ